MTEGLTVSQRLPQDPSDAFDWEQWFAPMKMFQDIRLGASERLMVPPGPERTGRLTQNKVLRYLASKDLLAMMPKEEE